MQIKQSTFYWLIIFILAFLFLYLVGGILMPFIFGIIVGYFLDPVADKLEERGLSRTTSTLIVLALFSLILVSIISLFGPLLIEQIGDLISKIPLYAEQFKNDYGQTVQDFLARLLPDFKNNAQGFVTKFSDEIFKVSTALLTGIISSSSTLFNILSLVLISPIVAYYMLKDWDKIVRKVDDLLPREKVSMLRRNFANIDRIISAYIRGQVTVCLIMATFYSINLTIVGLNYGFAIGFLTGVFSFIPYIGMAVGAFTGIMVAYMQFGMTEGILFTVAVFIFGNIIEGNFITPKLVGESVELHPAWVIFALLAGGTLFGFTGVLIAIPAAAVIGVLTRSTVDAYMHSGLYLGYENNNPIINNYPHPQQEGEITERVETPFFQGFEEEKVVPKAEKRAPEKKVVNDYIGKKKKKKKKKEPELKFTKH